MDKEDVVQIYNGIQLNHKKELKAAIWSNMDEPEGHYAKWRKSDRERQILYITRQIVYVESKKYNKLVNKTTKKKQMQI